ncbi:MAG: MerC family mercury resistance protein [Candidatus Rokuibacteriota bacterium]
MSASPRIGSAGVVASVLAMSGCLGLPLVVVALAAVGATEILEPRHLLPILVVSLTAGLWRLLETYRWQGEPWPLVFGLVGGAAALMTEVVRAATHQHAYFLGYPGVLLLVIGFLGTVLAPRSSKVPSAPRQHRT